ncbi:MAG: protein kinase [Deltaproteobacteria bacterium]|nr:protein kinase [Deltaproteobacteria bacterium]
MRCEVCGAPLSGEETICELCSSRRLSSNPESPTSNGDDAENQDTWKDLSPPSGSRKSFPVSDNNSSVNVSKSIVLEDKYLLRDEIGRGAMGTVFLAEDKTLQRQVAVKFLLPELSNSPDCAVRFRREAIGMAAIRDNNVAQIYAYGEYGNIPYFVMEHLEGETAESLIDSHNRRGFFIPLRDTIDIIVQAVSGLAAIHRAGAIHRDIKPGNIMIAGDPMRVVIMDFGLVRTVKMDDEVRTLAGTPAYIAPELVEGKKDSDRSPLTDIYSMGTSIYEILTGSLPFNGETWVEILRKHITEIPVDPSEKRPGIPEELDEIILCAMSKDPKERYQSSDEFLEDLLEIEQMSLYEEEQSVPPGSPTGTKRRSSSRRFRSSPPGGSLRSTPGSGRGRLLVVDPDSDFRTLVHETAKAVVPGCRVRSAADGAMALKLAKEFAPHAMVVDLSLPEVNGLEVVATLRGDPEFDDLEIIVVADRGGRREADILTNLKVGHFLTKPVDADTLGDVIRPVLERPLTLLRKTPTNALLS